MINTLAPQATRLGEALTALAAAALTLRARVVPHVSPWTLIGQITHGRLPARPCRPGRAEIRSCLVLARLQPDATVTTANRHARDRNRQRDDQGATVTTSPAGMSVLRRHRERRLRRQLRRRATAERRLPLRRCQPRTLGSF